MWIPSPTHGTLLRLLIKHSRGIRKKLHCYLRIFTWRAPQLCAAAPTPLSAVQQYTPSSLSSTLRMVRSCPFLWMLYRVSNSLQGTPQIARDSQGQRNGIAFEYAGCLSLQMAISFTFDFSAHKQKGRCLKC